MSKPGKQTAAGRKKRAGKHVSHAKARPYQPGSRKRRRPDPFDAVLDARSEARYEDDSCAEPDTGEVSERAMMPTQGAVSPAERRYGRG